MMIYVYLTINLFGNVTITERSHDHMKGSVVGRAGMYVYLYTNRHRLKKPYQIIMPVIARHMREREIAQTDWCNMKVQRPKMKKTVRDMDGQEQMRML